ncbi:MAG: fluoride efflux transporter CrcB [Acidimicrobiia bacterium]
MSSPERDNLLPVDPDLVAVEGGARTARHPPARRGARRGGRNDPRVLAAVSLGGALGAPARYGIAQLIDITPGTFPWGTFWINVSGSLAVGFVLVLVLERFPPTRYIRPFVATGFLGAYTTYSTFAVETDLLIKNGHWAVALAYAAASFAAGFLAVWAGIVLARAVPSFRSDRHAT